MPSLRYHVALDDTELAAGFQAIRDEIGVEPFSEAVLADAQAAAERGPTLPPDADPAGWQDRTDLDLVAIDPPGSLDLDQAYGAERRDEGYRIHYAIADVAAFVAPGSLTEQASLERGVTLYAPDKRTSLHPPVINEDVASLRQGVDRPSVLWTIDLDAAGKLLDSTLKRCTVNINETMSYRAAQDEIDSGSARTSLALLKEIGQLRQQRERDRGAVSLNLPAQEVERDSHGHPQLVFDQTLPVENWNAQISLLTGIAAAHHMVDADLGLLRTLPTPDPETIEGLRRTARGLGVPWPDNMSYADRVRDLNPNEAHEAALLMRSARGLRGAGYLALVPGAERPSSFEHSAIASIYAHVTAPLRRVCDRYANEIVLAICADRNPAAWAVELLPELPSILGKSRQREGALERAVIDYMEAMMLEHSIGQTFEATVVNHRRDKAVIQLRDPAVVAEIEPKPRLGKVVEVKLVAADPQARSVRFELV